MAFSKQNICPRCGEPCSPLKNSCPSCGAKIRKPSGRSATSSDAVRRGTAAGAKAQENTRWQLIVGLCLVAAVIIAVIVLITTTLKGDFDNPAAPAPSQEVAATPSPTPAPTPTPTPSVEWLKITYYGDERTEFVTSVGGTTPLGTSHFPIEVEGEVTWTSADTSICTVSETGVVTGVGLGNTSIIARMYGAAAECKVYVS